MMNATPHNKDEPPKKDRRIPVVSTVLDDGTMVETVLSAAPERTSFLLARDGEWHQASSIPVDAHTQLVPYSSRNNLLAHEVVLLPSQPEEYASEDALLLEIES